MATKIDITKYATHLNKVGAKNLETYLFWCKKNGFSTATNKSKSQLAKELEFVEQNKAAQYLSMSNLGMNCKRAVELMRSGIENFTDKTYNAIAKIYHDIEHPEFLYIDKDMFLSIISFFDKRTKILKTDKYVLPLARVLVKKNFWINSWDTWEPSTYNADRQFSSFLRHLMAKYDVPIFFDNVWFASNEKHHDWFIHVAQGQNILTAREFVDDFPCTKKMAHFFMQAPSTYTFARAWRYGQVRALRGTPRLAEAIIGSKIYQEQFKNTPSFNEFSLSVIRFFISNPMLDLHQIAPIVDYIWNQKYEHQRVFINQELVTQDPPQPNFSMTGRTVDTLLTQVEEWHKRLGKEKKSGDMFWPHSAFKDFMFQEGADDSKGVRIWRITELLTSKELIAEGRTMSHCVASYSGSCVSGKSSIWSLTREDHEGRFKHLTIEVSAKKINQVRGIRNREATVREKSIISRWSQREGIGVESYIW